MICEVRRMPQCNQNGGKGFVIRSFSEISNHFFKLTVHHLSKARISLAFSGDAVVGAAIAKDLLYSRADGKPCLVI